MLLAPLTERESAVATAGAVIGQQFSIDALPPVACLDHSAVMSAVGGLTAGTCSGRRRPRPR